MAEAAGEWREDPNAANKGPDANAVVWAFTSIATVFLGIRVFCKYRKHRSLWWDDWVLVASWLLLLAYILLFTTIVCAGFGKHMADVDSIGVRYLALGTLVILSAVRSKTSFAITLFRITGPRLQGALWAVIVTMNVFASAASVVQWTQCQPMGRGWHVGSETRLCLEPQITLGVSVFGAAYSGFMDLVLAFLAWVVVIRLQMKTTEKIGIAVAMSMGVLASIAAVVKCVKLSIITSGDFTYEGSELIIWATAESATTVTAASIPVLRTLLLEVASRSRRSRSSQKRAGSYFQHVSLDAIMAKARNYRLGINTITLSSSGESLGNGWGDIDILQIAGGRGRDCQDGGGAGAVCGWWWGDSVQYEMERMEKLARGPV